MRLGFVGVGNWAQKLATAFRECGAEIVAHSRKYQTGAECLASTRSADGFGRWVREWSDLVTDPAIDALIICAPPAVTTEVALACAKAGKRCVATKPLLWTEAPTGPGAPAEVNDNIWRRAWARDWLKKNLYVDLWRLYSPAWLALKEELRGKKIERIDVSFCGNGPFRSYNGALDYGPHALAFVFDLLGTTEVSDVVPTELKSESPGGKLYGADMRIDGTFVDIVIGNGTEGPERRVVVWAGDQLYTWDEPNEDEPGQRMNRYLEGDFVALECEKSLALRRFCRAFMAGEASRTLELSICAQRVLERIVGA